MAQNFRAQNQPFRTEIPFKLDLVDKFVRHGIFLILNFTVHKNDIFICIHLGLINQVLGKSETLGRKPVKRLPTVTLRLATQRFRINRGVVNIVGIIILKQI
ncbi:MAG: hypothetical protein WC505_08150, partial [Patescibacteria group bacterium]